MSDNSSTRFEVALEILGQSRQPYMHAIRNENAKEKSNVNFITYCEAWLLAIDNLQEDLLPDDIDTVNEILNPKSKLFPR